MNASVSDAAMKTHKTSSKHVRSSAAKSNRSERKCSLMVKSPVSKIHDMYHPNDDHTSVIWSRKTSNHHYTVKPNKSSSKMSTSTRRSRKRNEKEKKHNPHRDDYFQPSQVDPSEFEVERAQENDNSSCSGYQLGRSTHESFSRTSMWSQSTLCFQFPGNRPKLPDEDKFKVSRKHLEDPPTLRSMGIFKDDEELVAKDVWIPQKRSILDALYERVAYFVKPDMTVRIGSTKLKCHKIVLQCYSKYFEQLKNETKVNIDGVSKRAFIAIYNWMLAATFEDGLQFIEQDNILEVLIASRRLAVIELESQCLALIDSKEAFSEQNAFLLFIDASRTYQREIIDLMVPRIQVFFLVLVSSNEYAALEVDNLCIILQSDYIVVHCELEVFMSAVKWLMFNWEERSKYMRTVMKSIRFGLMTPGQLVDIRKNPNSPEFIEIAKDETVQQLIEDGLAYSVEKISSGKEYHHAQRCDLLKLKIPKPRNWADKSKDYKSYMEYLDYLSEINTDPQSFYCEVKEDYLKAAMNSNDPNGTSDPVVMKGWESDRY